MQPKISLDLCLELMGLENLKEGEERWGDLDRARAFFEEIESRVTKEKEGTYTLEINRNSENIRRKHQLFLKMKNDRILAHYILRESESSMLPTFDESQPEYRTITEQTDIMAEFLILEEESLMVYEIGKVHQVEDKDSIGGCQLEIHPIRKMGDIEEDKRSLNTIELNSPIVEKAKEKRIQF